MSPDDIDQVTSTWRQALTEPDLLHEAIAERLAGSSAFRADRAGWIVRAVSGLAPVLHRPTAFAPAAAELISSRYPVTIEELAGERDALLGALEERCGPLPAATSHAWDLAIELFAEIVCAVGLDPFGCAGDPVRAVP